MAIQFSDENFEVEVLKSNQTVLVDFWAPWCGPCKMLSPIVDELSKEYEGKIKFCKANTDENMTLSSQFQITSIPCLIIFKEGKPIRKIVGFKPKSEIKRDLDEII